MRNPSDGSLLWKKTFDDHCYLYYCEPLIFMITANEESPIQWIDPQNGEIMMKSKKYLPTDKLDVCYINEALKEISGYILIDEINNRLTYRYLKE